MNIQDTARRRGLVSLAALTMVAVVTGCSVGSDAESQAGDGTGKIEVWASQGQEAEVAALQGTVDKFNASQSDVEASLKVMPGDTYTQTISNTPASKLPDVMAMDGPTMASFVYNKKISRLSDYVSHGTIDNATAGAIAEGTNDGELYGLAQFDSAIGLLGNKAILESAGVRVPTSIEDAWSADEFADVLKKLAAVTPSGKAIDLREQAFAGEWGTYAYSPLLYSAGGSIFEDNKASGALDSSASVEALTTFASWKPYVASSPDGKAFPNGQVGLLWGGHWLYPEASAALGDDNVVALPLPDLGEGAKADAGSWEWGIGSSTQNGKAAGVFLDYLLNDESVAMMVEANGAPPATQSALENASLYQSGGALELWGEQLARACASDEVTSDCVSVYRPVTPGYPTVTTKFGSALSAIYGGADPQAELTKAAQAIDSVFADNNYYQ